MFVYDFKGKVEAHGQNAALVGQNLIDLSDSRGKPIIKNLYRLRAQKVRDGLITNGAMSLKDLMLNGLLTQN